MAWRYGCLRSEKSCDISREAYLDSLTVPLEVTNLDVTHCDSHSRETRAGSEDEAKEETRKGKGGTKAKDETRRIHLRGGRGEGKGRKLRRKKGKEGT